MESQFNRVFERLLVFTTAVSLLLTASGIFSIVLNNSTLDKLLIDWFTYTFIILSGIVFTLVLQIFAHEKIKAAMNIVFIVFYVIAAVLISYFAGKKNAPYMLIPLLVIEYSIQVLMNEMFIYHDRFLDECGEYEGNDLAKHLFHNNLAAIDLTDKTKNQQVMMFALSIVMFIILVFGKLSGGLFNFIIDLMVIIFYLSVLLCCFILGLFRNDIFFAFLGFKEYLNDRKKLFRAIFIIILISLTAGFIFSSDNPLIKIKYVENYSEVREPLQAMPEMQDFDMAMDFRNELENMYGKDQEPIWIFLFLAKVIKYAAITALCVFLVIFFFKPFFSKHWKVFWSERRLVKFFYQIWDEIKLFFKYIFTKNKAKEAYSTVESKKFRTSMMDFLKKSKRSKEKIAEIDRLTKHFMRLIDWGEAKNIKYRTNLAPAEYTALIEEYLKKADSKPAENQNASDTAASATEKNKKEAEIEAAAAYTAGMLFEKALYDKNILSKEDETQFIEYIKNITHL